MTNTTINPKFNPYLSAKHTDDLSKNYNGVYQNPKPDSHPKNSIFWCRHFAVLAAEMAKSPDFKNNDFFQLIQSSEAPNKLAEISYEEFKSTAPHRAIVSNKNFGTYIKKAFQAVMAEGKLGGTFIISAEHHVLQGSIRHKIKNEQPQYVARVMDPNLSTTHGRCAKSHPTEFDSISFEYFLEESHQSNYFPGTEPYPLVIYSQNIPPFAWHNEHDHCLSSDLMSQRLFLAAAQEDFPETIRLFENHSVDQLQKLFSHTEALGCLPLYLAIQNNNLGAVKALMKLIKTLPLAQIQTTTQSTSCDALSPEQFMEILTCKSKFGLPGLHMAMENGYVEVANAFLSNIRTLALSQEQQHELLACKDPQGNHGLLGAMLYGKSNVVEAYLTALCTFPLTQAQFAEILNCKDDNGISGLFMAMQNGLTDVVKAHITAIQELNLTPEHKFEILDCKDAAGYPALALAMQGGHAENVKNYLTAVHDLPLQQRTQLMAGNDDQDISALTRAVHEGHTETVKAWWTEVQKLPDPLPRELLFSSDSQGNTTKDYAEKIGNAEMLALLNQMEVFAMTSRKRKVPDSLGSSQAKAAKH